MKKYILVYTILLGVLSCIAQPNRDYKRDFVWLFGYTDISNTSPYGNTKVDFNTNPPTVTSIGAKINFDADYASICDTAGNLLFSTNGQEVFNKNHVQMDNGIINAGDFWNTCFYNGQTQGMGIVQGALALPFPNHANLYKLFYTGMLEDGNYFLIKNLLTATIDMEQNNGLGAVTNKDISIWQDTINASLLTACRHANGRDWWILVHRWGLDTTYRFLLDPTGVHLKGKQHLQAHLPGDILTGSSGRSWYAAFSPDGSKYAIYNAIRVGVFLYDFDRCTGLLSNKKIVWRPQMRGGVAFSPNSRYLYALDGEFVTQFDTHASNVSSTLDTVGRRDTTVLSMGFDPVYFFMPQAGPDGKIYFNCAGSGTWLHTIENPDAGGDACNVHIGTVPFPHWSFRTMANFPNFRLGALRGSPCDTLGIEEGVTVGVASPSPSRGGEQIRLFPNPAGGILNVEYADYTNKQLIITNALGVSQKTLSLQSETTTINIQDLSNGIYYLSIYENSRLFGSRKFVVLH